jgi:hypothetical protein
MCVHIVRSLVIKVLLKVLDSERSDGNYWFYNDVCYFLFFFSTYL